MNTLIKPKRKANPIMPDLKKDKDFNLKFYEVIPPGFCLAKIEDFWDFDADDYIMNKAYIQHSEKDPERYYALRTTKGFTERNDFWEFLRKGRVYVFEK